MPAVLDVVRLVMVIRLLFSHMVFRPAVTGPWNVSEHCSSKIRRASLSTHARFARSSVGVCY